MSHRHFWIEDQLALGPTIDRSAANGHVYSGGAPGLAFTLVPTGLGRVEPRGPALVLVLTVLGAALPCALGTLAVRRAALAVGAEPATATLAAVAHGLGTIALPFATRLYAHSLVVCLVAWSLALVLERRRLALAGLLAAWAVVCDYNVALVAAALVGFAAFVEGPRGALRFVAGAAGPAVLLGAYHTACFGAPWRTPYDFHADAHTQALVKESYGFSWPRPRIVLELLFGLRRGFLFTQPIALLGIGGLALLARKDRRAAFALVVATLVVLMHASRARDWHAGASYGARYSMHALPFIALGYAHVLERAGRARVPLVVASALLAFAGATSTWGFDVIVSWQTLWLMGPRAGAVVAALGLDENVIRAAWVSLVALMVALPVSVGLLAGARLGPLSVATLAPLLASLHGLAFAFVHPPESVLRGRIGIERESIVRKIDSTFDVEEARGVLYVALMRRDAELVKRAEARIAALEGR